MTNAVFCRTVSEFEYKINQIELVFEEENTIDPTIAFEDKANIPL